MPWGSTSILVSAEGPSSVEMGWEKWRPPLNGFLLPLPRLPGASLEPHSSHRPGLIEEEICKDRAGVALPREILFFKGHCPHRKSLRGRPTCWAPLSHAPTPRKLTVTTHSRRHTRSPQPASHWLSLSVTNSPCRTDTQRPMPSDKKSHIQQ